ATHYHELTELIESCARAENHSVSAREHAGSIVFFHKVQRGAASRSYGVACARLAGLPEPVLARAKAILEGLEKDATLPNGKQSRSKKATPQLGLFGAGAAPAGGAAAAAAANLALDMLRAV